MIAVNQRVHLRNIHAALPKATRFAIAAALLRLRTRKLIRSFGSASQAFVALNTSHPYAHQIEAILLSFADALGAPRTPVARGEAIPLDTERIAKTEIRTNDVFGYPKQTRILLLLDALNEITEVDLNIYLGTRIRNRSWLLIEPLLTHGIVRARKLPGYGRGAKTLSLNPDMPGAPHLRSLLRKMNSDGHLEQNAALIAAFVETNTMSELTRLRRRLMTF